MNYEELYQNAVNLFKEKKLEQSVSIINKLLKNIENNSLYQELYVKATNLHAAYNESKGNLKGSIRDLKVVNKLEPYNVNYLNNIGQIYMKIHKEDKAKIYFEKAVFISKHDYIANSYLSRFHVNKRNYSDALVYLKMIIEGRSISNYNELAITYSNISVLSYGVGSYKDYLLYHKKALISWIFHKKSISLDGIDFMGINDNEVLNSIVDKVLDIDNSYEIYFRIITLLVPEFYNSQDEMNKIREDFEENIQKIIELLESGNIERDLVYEQNISYLSKIKIGMPFSYQNSNNIKLNKLISKFYRSFYGNIDVIDSRSKLLRDKGIKSTRKKIKVGFLSSNFYNHSVGKDRRGLIKRLSKKYFEVVVFMFFPPHDFMSHFIANSADKLIIFEDSIKNQQQQISNEKLDVLLFADIGMDIKSYLLSVGRYAPVQVATWGHSDTSGIDNIDYFVSSKLFEQTEPGEAQKNYCEKLALFDSLGTYYYSSVDKNTLNKVVERSRYGLPDGVPIYIVPHTLFKIHSIFDEYIYKILEKDRNCLIIFLDGQKQLLKQQFYHRIQDKLKTDQTKLVRVRFLPHQVMLEEYLSLLKICDVILDSYPFGGCNGSFEAFSMGKCVVTHPSKYINGRFTHGLYQKMGILDLVATDIDDYVEKAYRVANDKVYREELGERILENCYKIFEEEQTINEWDNFFKEITKPYLNIEEVTKTRTLENEIMDMSLYRETYLLKRKMDNSILIVGNGTSCLDKMDGEIVQGFDEVYRFNFYETDGYKGYVGTRTTHWCITDKITEVPNKYINNENLEKIICFIPSVKRKFVESVLSKNNKFMMLPEWVETNIKKDYYKERDVYWVSTGLMILYYLINTTKKNIYLKGFDHFIVNNGNYHYYGKEDRTTSDHDNKLEEIIINNLMGSGRVYKL